MVPATAEAIGPRHQPHRVRRHVARAPPLNEARQLARRRVLGTFRVHAYRRAVDDPAAAFVVADDVVVEDGVDAEFLSNGLLGVQPRADEALLLANVAHED